MEFHVSLAGRGDRATRIYRQLRDAILDGWLRPGEKLPPSRELARQLVVSRNTVSVAYDRLTAEGFLVGRVGSGTFVDAAPPPRGRTARVGPLAPAKVWRDLPEQRADTDLGVEYDFRVGCCSPRSARAWFPYGPMSTASIRRPCRTTPGWCTPRRRTSSRSARR
jgi:GntR family transcriptional regulator/MocR family aminotransferase